MQYIQTTKTKDVVKRARVAIFSGLLNSKNVFNTDTMGLTKDDVLKLVQELKTIGLEVVPSWYWDKYTKCNDEWALKEHRCGRVESSSGVTIYFPFHNKTIEETCLKRKSECEYKNKLRTECFRHCGTWSYWNPDSKLEQCKKNCIQTHSYCTPIRACNPRSDICFFSPCAGLYNEIHIKIDF